MAKPGRPERIGEREKEVLAEIAREPGSRTLGEMGAELVRRTGVSAHEATIRKALLALGLRRHRGEEGVRRVKREEGPRYGYTEAHRRQVAEQAYPSSLTDQEWELVKDLFEPPNPRGKPPQIPRRAVVDACCYVVRTGCAWRMLPREFPPWDNVYKSFRRWSAQGKFKLMHKRLAGVWREREGRSTEPSAAVLDAQSARISPQGGDSGYDAGKKVKGRKRNLVVDTLGLLLAVTVCAAGLQDRDAGLPAVEQAMASYPTLKTLFVDSAYARGFAHHVEHTHGMRVEVVRHPANRTVGRWANDQQPDLFEVREHPDGFVPLPKRWVVERTHAWNERARRLIMHHDVLTEVSEAWTWLAEARMLLRRLTISA